MSSTRRKNIWKIEKCTKQLVLIVGKNAKFLSSQHKANPSDAKIASERTDPKEVLAVEMAVIVDLAETTDSTIDQEKCTKQLALNVAKNAKFHSSQQATNQSDAENVFKRLETKVSNN